MQKMLSAEKDGGDRDQHAAHGDEILARRTRSAHRNPR